jgi:4-amino-4-deoxychorismate lyase
MPTTNTPPVASGVFETLAIIDGVPRWPERHLARLYAGCQRLGLTAPEEGVLRDALAAQAAQPGIGVVKITVTAGGGGPDHPARWAVAGEPPRLRPAQWARDGVNIITCRTRWPIAPQYAGLKLLDRTPQVQARSEWTADCIAEGLMFDADGSLISGTMTNVYAVIDDVVCTPALVRCGVAGTMRAALLDAWKGRGQAVLERDMHPLELTRASEVFLSNALIGIWPVRRLDERVYEIGAVAREAAAWLTAPAR